MEALIAIVFFPLFVAAGALAVWTLALLALEGRWALFVAGLLFFVPIGIFLIWKRRPQVEFADTARLLIDGSILAAALFLPLWALLVIFFLLLAMEIKAALWQQTGSGLYAGQEPGFPSWPRAQKAAPLAATKLQIQRAGLLEERVLVKEEKPVEVWSDEYAQPDTTKSAEYL